MRPPLACGGINSARRRAQGPPGQPTCRGSQHCRAVNMRAKLAARPPRQYSNGSADQCEPVRASSRVGPLCETHFSGKPPSMAVIEFGCPRCGATSQAPAELAGQQVICPGCRSVLVAPHLDPPPAAPSASPAGSMPVPARTPAPFPAAPPPMSPPPAPFPAAPPPMSPPPAPDWTRPVPVVPRLVPVGAPTDVAAELDEPPVRRLTPEERGARRARRNIVMAALGTATLIVTMFVLLRFVRR